MPRLPDVLRVVLVLALGLAGCATSTTPTPDDVDSGRASGATNDTGGDSGCEPQTEIAYDGIDQDCDGADLTDADGDGYDALAVPGGTDCDDRDPAVSPGTPELCDGLDQDCDGLLDEDIVPMWYRDGDGDGYGDPYASVCVATAGYVLDDSDCDDVHVDVHPGTVELCDGRDNDCDGALEPDADADGASCENDCDDEQPRAASGFVELCGDGIDNDCDGAVDADCADAGCEWTVPTEMPSIQSAIHAASDGDTICVEPGTYTTYFDFEGKAVALVGLGGSAATILTPPENQWGVSFVSAEGRNTVMEGFTMTGGGHVELEDASPTLVDVVVEDVWDWSGVGGIYVEHGAPVFWDVVVRDTTPSYGTKNEGFGGGMYLRSTHATLNGVVIEGCTAGSSGGGILAEGSDLGLSNVVLRGNVAWGSYWSGAGGLQATRSSVRLVNVRFDGNLSSISWETPPGGGIGLESSILYATNVTICDNATYNAGGGLYVLDSTATLTNTILCTNSAEWDGGGIQVDSGAVTLRYSDIWGNTPDDVVGMADPTGTDGNVSVDPVFSDDDAHLDPSSPLVDAGDPSLLDADGTRSDMGAWGGPGGAGW